MNLDDIFALAGTSSAELARARTTLGALLRTEGIGESDDLVRVRSLAPRVDLDDAGIQLLSAYLRHYPYDPRCPEHSGDGCLVCGGTGWILLRPPQANALREVAEMRGGFLPMRVGSGKTLVTLLLATLLGIERAVLMLPAQLIDKTRREFAIYFKAWRVRMPTLLSYEMLSHPDHEHDLLRLKPGLLILDEAHKSRNRSAAVSRRVRRCIELVNPIVVVLSGTLITDRLMDYQHLALYSLRGNAPIPAVEAEAQRWATAIDKDVPITARSELGALVTLPGGFHEHFRSRRGIVPTPGSDCDASIEVSWWRPDLPEVLRQTIAVVEASGIRPDGELLDPMKVPDCLCELAQGFYLKWRDPPPAWWLDPRRAYFSYERAVLDEHLDACARCHECWPTDEAPTCRCPSGPALASFDSPEHVRRGLDGVKGKARPPGWREGAELLARWRAVKDEYVPVSVPEWIDDSPLQQAVAIAEPETLVWVKRRAAGERLAALGIPYYGAGTDPTGARGTIALSLRAHATGKNLQAWARNLLLHPQATADGWEQWMGRTHRANQRADVVTFKLIDAIAYHRDVADRVLSQARRASEASGFDQKVLAATWIG